MSIGMICCHKKGQDTSGTKQTLNEEEKGEGNVKQGSESVKELGREEETTEAVGFRP